MQIMTREQMEAYREKFRKDTAKGSGELFQHFDTSEEWERHLAEVKQLQDSGSVPF